MPSDLQQLCEAGSQALCETQYLRAEQLLLEAEALALKSCDFDSLSRLYFPLQEARRQRRQRCGEGIVRLDLTEADLGDPDAFARRHPQGQFLVIGDRSTAPAERLREAYHALGTYGEVFLAAAIPVAPAGRVVAVLAFPADLSSLPATVTPDRLAQLLPPHTVLLPATPFGVLSTGQHPGTPTTFAATMSLWERLHLPHLALADATTDPETRLHAYRRVTEIDYACELAHQNAAFTARQLARTGAPRLP